MPTRISIFALIIIATQAIVGCAQPSHTKKSIEMAMQHYNQLLLNKAADSIALLFTPDGDLGGMAHGQDSIRKFLAGFSYVTVLSQSSTTHSIDIIADTAIQRGTYRQSDIVNARDTMHVKGNFIATWLWNQKEGWKIKKMETTPSGK